MHKKWVSTVIWAPNKRIPSSDRNRACENTHPNVNVVYSPKSLSHSPNLQEIGRGVPHKQFPSIRANSVGLIGCEKKSSALEMDRAIRIARVSNVIAWALHVQTPRAHTNSIIILAPLTTLSILIFSPRLSHWLLSDLRLLLPHLLHSALPLLLLSTFSSCCHRHPMKIDLFQNFTFWKGEDVVWVTRETCCTEVTEGGTFSQRKSLSARDTMEKNNWNNMGREK